MRDISKILKEKKIDQKLCVRCKGAKLLCGYNKCPILEYFNLNTEISKSKYLFDATNKLFVGRKNYPNLNFGPRVGDVWDTKKLFKMEYNEIISALTRPVWSIKQKHIKQQDELVYVGLSKRPIDVEVEFKKEIQPTISFGKVIRPIGAIGPIKRAEVAENPRIPRIVDKLIDDEVKSVEVLSKMYSKKLSVDYMQNALSTGLLGVNKKMVPTRWSITATDDTLSKIFIKNIKEYPQLNEIRVFRYEYLKNKYTIILYPSSWQFENFEIWHSGSSWYFGSKYLLTYDYEHYDKKREYSGQAGGYYATKFAVTEYLNKIKRQAGAIAIREIFPGYMIPVGVWQVRESIRAMLKKKYITYQTLKEALFNESQFWQFPFKEIIDKLQFLNQTKITDYF